MTYRIPTTKLELPNNDNDLRVPVNGIHNNTIFNDKIDLLIENFDYLLDSASVIDNKSPNAYEYAYDFFGDVWTDAPSSLVATPPSDHNYKFVEVVEMYNGQFLYICSKSNQIDFYIGGDISGNDTAPLTLKISYKQFKQKGSQLFKNITHIKYDSERLYVYDSEFSAVIVYDITSLIYSDVVVENIKFVKQLSQIKNLIALDCATQVYVITNTELIILNRDLNIQSKVNLNTPSPSNILIGDDIYVLYGFKIDYYNLSLEYIKSVEFLSINFEQLIDIESSKVDQNIVYLLTSMYVYKYDIVDNATISYFKLGIDRDKVYLDIYVKDGLTEDQIFLIDSNKLHFIKDSINLVYLYDRNNLLDIQKSEDIQINDLELEQDFVFNSSIQRILFNNLLLYNSLIFKAVSVTDPKGFLEYSYKKNLTNSNEINPDIIFIGQNEVFSYQVFQRAFNEVLKIQNSILELLSYEYVKKQKNTLYLNNELLILFNSPETALETN